MSKTLTCLIVDDIEEEVEMMCILVSKVANLKVVYATHDPLQARDFLLRQSVDIAFTDIDMPELSGLQLAKICQGRAHFVLCTGYAQYGAESYDYQIVDYLLKPIYLPRLIKAVEKVEQKLQTLTPALPDEYIFLKTDRHTQLKVYKKEIVSVEAKGNYVFYHTTQRPDTNKIMVHSTMQKVADQLASDGFVRIHKSHLVSLRYVLSMTADQVWVMGLEGKKVCLPLGKHYKESFIEALQKQPTPPSE